MDFHTLSRRELQALCKKNKIPANITNVAMAEALKALQFVEGVEEVMQPSQSETAQSSIESMDMSEVTSPFVPPTAGRSTRRTTKQGVESVNPMTRTRRTARKTQITEADANETPAVMARTDRKKAPMASACRKMDSQLKECVEEVKKDFLTTPATLGVTGRRKKAEESVAKRAYSTRRSVRLAVKQNVEMLNDNETEESQVSKMELLTKDGENGEMDLKDGSENINELSGISDADDAITTTTEVNSEIKDEPEVVSEQKQDASIGEEIKLGINAEEDKCTNFEKEAKLDEEKGDETEGTYGENTAMPLDVSNEVQQSEGFQDVYTPEIEITVENNSEGLKGEEGEASQDETAEFVENGNLESTEITVENKTEELKAEEGEASQDMAADFVENANLESGDNFVVNESSCDNTGFHDEIEKVDGGCKDVPELNVTLFKLTELTLQQATKEADSDSIDRVVDIPLQPNTDEPNEIEVLQLEESEEIKKAADQVPSDEPYADFSEQIPTSGYVQPNCLTPNKISASKAFTTMKRMTVFSDNKENIGSDSKLVIMKDVPMAKKSENFDSLQDLSVRKLTKMLKEKLEITKKSSKNEHGNEAISRPALQALPENRLVDETQN